VLSAERGIFVLTTDREVEAVEPGPMGTRRRLLVVALVIGAVATGAVTGWLVGRAGTDELEERIGALEQQIAQLEAAGERPPGDSTPEHAEPEPAPEADPDGPLPESVRGQTAYVTAVVVADGGTVTVTLDYIEFLTGDEAVAAASAAGEESPPPNDYFIRNDDDTLREFPVRPGIPVTVVFSDDRMSVPAGREVTLDAWAADALGPMFEYYTATYYLVDIENGVVVSLAQQYLP
jgi:type II secretory pathway pseudopilin PulG